MFYGSSLNTYILYIAEVVFRLEDRIPLAFRIFNNTGLQNGLGHIKDKERLSLVEVVGVSQSVCDIITSGSAIKA